MGDYWARETSPSTELRKWFDQDTERWERFRRCYREELQSACRKPSLEELARLEQEDIATLLYGAREHRYRSTRAPCDPRGR